MEKRFEFIDANESTIVVTVVAGDLVNFTATMDGEVVQDFNLIEPRTDAQDDLLVLWEEYNGKPMPDPENDCDLEFTLDNLADAIQDENEEYEHIGFEMSEDMDVEQRHINLVMERMGYDEYEAKIFIAMGMYQGMSVGDLEYDIEMNLDEHIVKVGNIEYYVGDSNELEDLASDIIHNDPEWETLWREAVRDERTTEGLGDWLDTVLHDDGYQSILGSYDGQSCEVCVCGWWYEIIRR